MKKAPFSEATGWGGYGLSRTLKRESETEQGVEGARPVVDVLTTWMCVCGWVGGEGGTVSVSRLINS